MLLNRRIGGKQIPKFDKSSVESCFIGYGDVPEWANILYEDIQVNNISIRTASHTYYWHDIEEWFYANWGDDSNIVDKILALASFDGQVKNFLVAASAVKEAHNGNYIAILGSRASSNSGNWLVHLLAWMESRFEDVTIVAYDYYEKDRIYIKGKNRFISSSRPYVGTGHEFDIVIDDIFTDLGPSTNPQWESKWWIRKDQSPGVLPFVHEREGRKYNFSMVQIEPIVCHCRRCSVEKCIPGITPYSDLVKPSFCRSYIQEHTVLSKVIPEWINGVDYVTDSTFKDLVTTLRDNIIPTLIDSHRIDEKKYDWKYLPLEPPVVKGIDLSEVPFQSRNYKQQTYSVSKFLVMKEYEEARDKYYWIMTHSDLPYKILEQHDAWKLYDIKNTSFSVSNLTEKKIVEISKELSTVYLNLVDEFFLFEEDSIVLLKDPDQKRVVYVGSKTASQNAVTAYRNRIDKIISVRYDINYFQKDIQLSGKIMKRMKALGDLPVYLERPPPPGLLDYFNRVYVRKKN